MEPDKATQAAVKHYEAMKKAQAKYYLTHKDDILRKCRERYAESRADEPPRRRGRPPKGPLEDASKVV